LYIFFIFLTLYLNCTTILMVNKDVYIITLSYLSDPYPRFQIHAIIRRWISLKLLKVRQ